MGCYNRPPETEINLWRSKQQVIDYFSRTPALQISIKLTHRKFGTRQAVPDRKIYHYTSGRIFLSGVGEIFVCL